MKSYKKPVLNVERFTANEFVAACGDLNKVYKFKCDAGGGRSGSVYLETNGKPGLQTTGYFEGWKWIDADDYLSGYQACGTTHEAKTTDDFFDGYYRYKKGGIFSGTETVPVKVWRGPGGDNTHCTENLDINSWETEKS